MYLWLAQQQRSLPALLPCRVLTGPTRCPTSSEVGGLLRSGPWCSSTVLCRGGGCKVGAAMRWQIPARCPLFDDFFT